MTINIWSSVGGVTTALPIETLLGTANQLLGMNPGATAAQWKSITFDNVAGQLANVAGAVGAPSYTMQGDLTTGWYRPAPGVWGFTINGVLAFNLTAAAIQAVCDIQMFGKLIKEDQSANIVAAATTDLDAATGNYITVTHAGGVVAITSFDGPTIPAGTCVEIKFSIAGGTLTLTHNAVSMILLGAANIILQNGDLTRWRKINDAAANWEMVGFQRGSNSSVLTTKGDLLVGLGAGITDRMGVPADGSFFVADSTQTTGWRSQAVTGSLVQQAVQKAVTDSNGQNSAITTGAGLRPGLSALAVACIFAFGDSGAIETFSANVVDILGADLPTSNTSFIYRNRGTTWTFGLVPEQQAYVFDRTKQSLMNFEAADGSTSIIDDFGNTWAAAGNAQIDTAQFKFGTSSLLLDGTGDFVSSSNFTSLGDGSWEISTWVRYNVLPTPAQFMVLFDLYNATVASSSRPLALSLNNTAGVFKLNLEASNDGTTGNITAGTLGTYTAWAINTWYKIRLVFDALAGTYRVYHSVNGAAETQDINVASALKVAVGTILYIGHAGGGAGYVDHNGWIDAFRVLPCATKTTTETPAVVAPTISDAGLLVNFYKIQNGTMYEVTGASIAAGTDPTFTARERLCVAECDTSGAAITAVRNRALKGQWVGTFTTPLVGVNVELTQSHNVGAYLLDADIELINLTGEFGWTVGDIVSPVNAGNATYAFNPGLIKKRNTIAFHSGNNSAFILGNRLNGDSAAITAAKWAYRFKVKRSW